MSGYEEIRKLLYKKYVTELIEIAESLKIYEGENMSKDVLINLIIENS